MGLFKQFMNEGLGSWLLNKGKDFLGMDTEPEYDNSPPIQRHWEPGAVFMHFKDILSNPKAQAMYVIVSHPGIDDMIASQTMKKFVSRVQTADNGAVIKDVMEVGGLWMAGICYKIQDPGDNVGKRGSFNIKMTAVPDPKMGQKAIAMLDAMPWPFVQPSKSRKNDETMFIDLNAKQQKPQAAPAAQQKPQAAPAAQQKPQAAPAARPALNNPMLPKKSAAPPPMSGKGNVTKKCPSCGRALPAGSDYCMICGQ